MSNSQPINKSRLHPTGRRFMAIKYEQNSYYHTVQQFIWHQQEQGVANKSLIHYYYSLHPLGAKRSDDNPTALDNPTLTSITTHKLKQYIKSLWLKYARDSINTTVGDIKQFFAWCHRGEILPNDIAIKIRRPQRSRRRKQKSAETGAVLHVIKWLTKRLTDNNCIYIEENAVKINPVARWTSHRQHEARDLFILTFLFETGARAGELCNLGRRRMNKAVETNEEGIYTIDMRGKMADGAEYLFTESTVTAWRIWDAVRPRGTSAYAVIDWHDGNSTNQVKTDALSKMLIRRCVASGLDKAKHFRSHALRSAKVVRTRKVHGLTIASLLVGHKHLSTTERYDDVQDTEVRAAAAQTGLASLFFE